MLHVCLCICVDNNIPLTIIEGRKRLSEDNPRTDIVFNDEYKKIGNSAISASEIYFRYGKDEDNVLNGASLNIYENELYAIVGGNGSGKTTLLSIMSGSNKPQRGRVTVFGNKRIAVLPQDPLNLFSHKTVMLDLEDAAKRFGVDAEGLNRITAVCEIGEILFRHPYDLS